MLDCNKIAPKSQLPSMCHDDSREVNDTTNLFFTPFAGFISRWEESWLEGKKVTKQWNNYSCFLLAYGNDWDINPEAENQEMSLGHFFAAAHF